MHPGHAKRKRLSEGLLKTTGTLRTRLPPKPKKKEISPLYPEQARAFLEAVREDRLEALYVLTSELLYFRLLCRIFTSRGGGTRTHTVRILSP